jgi:uncharacterized protein (TIGR03437 family)
MRIERTISATLLLNTVILVLPAAVTVTPGTITVHADAAALVASGEFRVNFTVPQQFATLPSANYPLTIAVNGVSSPANINSKPPAPLVVPVQH